MVLTAALVGGFAARLFKLPVLVGYLLAGVAIGPHTPGLLADEETVQNVANVGVILLMFAVGVQFSLKELGSIRRTALIAGSAQILGTLALGYGVGAVLGWSWLESLFLGCALAMSSTAVMLKLLEERGELGSTHGAIILGILIIQDLSLVAFMSLLPAAHLLANDGVAALSSVGVALLKAAAFIGVTLFLASRLVPKLLDRATRTGSPELFLLTVICLCFGAAVIAGQAGLGSALGAFLAGVVVSESPYAHEIFSQVRPLRDVFSSIFFVSIGMLANPNYFVSNWKTVALVVAVIIVGKFIITVAAIQTAGWHSRTAISVGAGLANIGEFSFVLAAAGLAGGLIGGQVNSAVIAAALVTLLTAPFVYGLAGAFYTSLARFRFFRTKMSAGKMTRESEDEEIQPQVLVLGGGRVGRYTSEALQSKSVPHLLIDFDSEAIDRAKRRKVPVLYGDATSQTVLEMGHPERAMLAVVALPEAAITAIAVKALRSLAPDLHIVARVRRGEDIPRMREAGASGVVHGEFEAGAEMIRQSFDCLDIDPAETERYVDEIRLFRYRGGE